jgi:PEGA domain
MRKLLLAGIVALAMLPASAAAHGRRGVFFRPVIVPHVWVGYGGWYDPFWGPYPYTPYVYSHSDAGKVKLETKAKDAAVYIDGSYAGTVRDLKTISLRSGSYTIEIRAPGGRHYEEKIYVIPGKTIHLRPDPDLNDGS